jgi:hypothetical protein
MRIKQVSTKNSKSLDFKARMVVDGEFGVLDQSPLKRTFLLDA